MNECLPRFRLTFLLFLLMVVPAAAQWHHPLTLGGGGWWRGRIRVVVESGPGRPAAGEPVAVKIGDRPGEADLVGQQAQAVRVCNQQGEEMLFAIQEASGSQIAHGRIAAGSTLLLPMEYESERPAVYYVYYDNPDASEVPDFLSASLGVVNGDMERGERLAPTGWNHDWPDDHHRASWSTERPQSGKRCLKTVVDVGAETTWIATRQKDIRIVGGAKYRMRAWVRADGVQGFAGWYIHLGNREKPMLIAPTLTAGGGTYGWKEVSAQFTAPPTANLADLGTVLRGTGTAWFDNVTLDCLEQGQVKAVAGEPERVTLADVGSDAPWVGHPSAGREPGRREGWDRRAAVRVFNFSAGPAARTLVCVDTSMFFARTRGGDEDHLMVADGGRPIDCNRLGNLLLFEGEVPASTVRIWHVYWQGDPSVSAGPAGKNGVEKMGTVPIFSGRSNLVENPGFESGGELPADWTHDPAADPAVRWSMDDPGRPSLGKRCVRMDVSPGAPTRWRGWHQTAPVRGGHKYLLAAWVKCKDVGSGEIRVHAHRMAADGRLSKHEPMASIGPGIRGTTDWTLLSGLITIPEDAVSLGLHLTTNATGTVWHDGLLLAEVTPADVAGIEGAPMADPDHVAVWPIPAVVKVFQEDPPGRDPGEARITAARNEQEPLQLAIRGGKAIRGVKVEIVAPKGPQGATLGQLEINVVGYVPIDYPTNYYQSRTAAWRRKIPAQPGGCDGWPGCWPDPLLPQSTFDLAANTTQAVWITVSVPKEAPAGDYRGEVRLVAAGRCLAQRQFTVHVWDFTLPDESHVAAKFDVGPGQGAALWGRPWQEVYPEIESFMARRRLCPGAVRPAPVIKCENGRVTADFTEFDKAADRYFNELKLPNAWMPEYFYLFGWGFPPTARFGEQPYPGCPPFEGADRSRLRPEFKRAYQVRLKAFWDHVKQKGWDKKFVLYISDEPFEAQPDIRRQMKALCQMIHEVDPKIRIYSSTWKHVPDWDGSLDIWGIGHYGIVPVEQIAKLRAAGDHIWWTTDGQMCTDTPYCAVERLLPHYCFKYGADAYEFWGVAWMTYDPYRFGWHAYIHQSDQPGVSYWVRYPNGDGFLLYPGGPIGHDGPVSSIRLEQAREGVEDYEYMYLLRQSMAKAKAKGADITLAEQAMARADRLVTIPNAGGRYSSKILPDPAEVYVVKEMLGAAVERCISYASSRTFQPSASAKAKTGSLRSP